MEHDIKLECQHGDVIHHLDDGYSLIMFNKFKIKKKVTINRVTKWILVPIEWYIHRNDFKNEL